MTKKQEHDEQIIYDTAEFRVPASDSKGHNVRQWFRCQPGHDRQVELVLRTKKFPYRTKGDILRHALVRHLRWIEEQAPVPSVMKEVDSILEIMRDEEFAQDFEVTFEKLGERINSHMARGAHGEARRLLLLVNRHISAMPEGYWRDRYEQEIKARYGYILDAPKARLVKRKIKVLDMKEDTGA